MKKNKFILLFISFFLFIPFVVKADTGYKIENYDIDIIVNENHVLDITETIDIKYSESSHGFIRKIPIKN